MTSAVRQLALKAGFRSGLEETISRQLTAAGITPEYESFKVRFTEPAKARTYTPDFKLPNGIIIETKGRFVTADRQKHLLVKAQCPDLDIRFVFSNSKTRISKGSPTTYASWCEKNGFRYADKFIPQAWLNEPKKETP
ncbi:MAG: endodeoxyribonuclease [Comamonadaceae bacterium]|nr:endodeoxyribonuclease [Comamonadaceae bacterium]